MTQSYPLYDELLKKVENRKDKAGIDVKRVCSTINNLSQFLSAEEAKKHYDEICGLIIHHDVLNRGMMTNIIPYEGKTMAGGKGILYSSINLPPLLQQIIAQYIEEYAA